MKTFFRRLAALLLAVLASMPVASASRYEPFAHSDVRFEDMAVLPIDRAEVEALCRRFARDPAERFDELLALYDACYTGYELAAIDSDRNAGDAARSDAAERAAQALDEAGDRISVAIRDALSADRGGALLCRIPADWEDYFRYYESAGEEDADEELALVQDYYLLPDDDNFAERAAEIYQSLAALRREEARSAGFDSFAAYAYAVLYAREYAPEDTQRLHRVVKSRIAPLYVKLTLALDECRIPWDDGDIPDAPELLDILAAHMSDISPELDEAMDALRRNGLYCIGSDDTLREAGYTTLLPAYRVPFLFNRVSTRFEAFETTVHEFGHFNAAWHDPTPVFFQLNNTDLSELQSQGLELLFLPCMQDILAGEDEADRAVVALTVLREMLGGVVDGCLYDELERWVYDAGTFTAEELSLREMALWEDYGLDELYEPEPDWFYVPHLFSSPFYYISYAVSALPALDLWLLSLEDRDAAAEIYLDISAARTDAWFLDVLRSGGLCDITRRGDAERLAEKLEARTEELLPPPGASAPIVSSPLLPALAIAAVLLLAAVFVLRRGRSGKTDA